MNIFDEICRLCLLKSENVLLNIFDEQGTLENIAAILNKHFWFEIKETDSNNLICNACWTIVKQFNNFFNLVKIKHEELLTAAVAGAAIDQNVSNEKEDENSGGSQENYAAPHRYAVFIKNEQELLDVTNSNINLSSFVSECDDSDSSSEPELKAHRQICKTDPVKLKDSTAVIGDFKIKCNFCEESFDSLELIQTHHTSEHKLVKFYMNCCNKKYHKLTLMTQHCQWHLNPDVFKCKECNKTHDNKYRLLDHIISAHTSASKRTKQIKCNICAEKFTDKKILTCHVRDCHTNNEKPFANKNEIIKKYFPMHCDLCAEPFDSFQSAQNHHKDKHGQAGYLTCCNRKFFKMFTAIQHCTWHDNPESFKCDICQKCFFEKEGLSDHMRYIHTPAESCKYKCELCQKVYPKKHLLNTHIRVSHVKNKKFECHICNQKYAWCGPLRSHIERVHYNVHSHMCDVCAKSFKSAKSCEFHYLSAHTNDLKKVQCELCGKWLKHYDSLKYHMIWHRSENAACELCGHVSPNKRALRSHMNSTHREASLQCNVCNKMFKNKNTLNEHMTIHTGISDSYSCLFCKKTFRSKANMYAHRKRNHPVEYAEYIKNRTNSASI